MTNRCGTKHTVLLSGTMASCSAFLFALFAEDFLSGSILYGASALCFGGSYTPVLTVISERMRGKRRDGMLQGSPKPGSGVWPLRV